MAFDAPLDVTHTRDQGLVVAGVPRIPNGEFGFRRAERVETSFVIIEHPDGTPEIRYPNNSYIKVCTLNHSESSSNPYRVYPIGYTL